MNAQQQTSEFAGFTVEHLQSLIDSKTEELNILHRDVVLPMRKKRAELKATRKALKDALRKATTGQNAAERQAERDAIRLQKEWEKADKAAQKHAEAEAKKLQKQNDKAAKAAEKKPAYDPIATGEAAWKERKAKKEQDAEKLAVDKAADEVSRKALEIKPIPKPSGKTKKAPKTRSKIESFA